ncbi:MAG: hypothetical protein EZS28_015972 [Streblomastix strix]|uniref:Uncharacterized protein n=2 Tax=Streblomastix strix TaxID=222440 RepID=A0A5J4W1U0_9EUKA|nr:MAG: hypothetical protein EZS28_015972 [Streblomastix strix]
MTFADIIQNRYGVPDTETDKEQLFANATGNTGKVQILFVGESKINAQQQTRALPDASIVNIKIDEVGDVNAVCPNLRHVELSNVGLTSWNIPIELQRKLPRLAEMNILHESLLGAIPDELVAVCHLKELCLTDCTLRWNDIKVLAQVPSLETLALVRSQIHTISIDGDDSNYINGFQKKLRISSNPITLQNPPRDLLSTSGDDVIQDNADNDMERYKANLSQLAKDQQQNQQTSSSSSSSDVNQEPPSDYWGPAKETTAEAVERRVRFAILLLIPKLKVINGSRVSSQEQRKATLRRKERQEKEKEKQENESKVKDELINQEKRIETIQQEEQKTKTKTEREQKEKELEIQWLREKALREEKIRVIISKWLPTSIALKSGGSFSSYFTPIDPSFYESQLRSSDVSSSINPPNVCVVHSGDPLSLLRAEVMKHHSIPLSAYNSFMLTLIRVQENKKEDYKHTKGEKDSKIDQLTNEMDRSHINIFEDVSEDVYGTVLTNYSISINDAGIRDGDIVRLIDTETAERMKSLDGQERAKGKDAVIRHEKKQQREKEMNAFMKNMKKPRK